ncbi:MAG: RsmD family RNA methyltransferase [Bacteroides sp.]|nr:RsmD family RNA methyltransferase [Eubacterium sp.]MCM1418993.1 RsmD family RNA methyltransferase [Roseburia sp.]MCM1463113.1 RsmD family RNA methyltransferase [Bacteroides sp.]
MSEDHRFGTDALLLARFAAPSRKDLVCDLCSGCGIVPMLFEALGTPPKAAYAVEIQAEAVALLQKTIEENGLTERIFPIRADLTKREELRALPLGRFSLVTVNPPYYKPDAGAKRLSPAQAIARHELFCNLEQVIETASLLLKYGGTLKLCHLPERLTDVLCLMRRVGIEPKLLQPALPRAGERPFLILVGGKKGGKPGLRWEAPVCVDQMNLELFGK